MKSLSSPCSRAIASTALLVGLVLSSCGTQPSSDSASGATAASNATAAASATPSSRKPQPTPAPACDNPQLDLIETELGLWVTKSTLYTETDGVPDDQWMEVSVIDNHFDPCADYSYVIVQVKPPEFVGSQLPPKEMVLFFAGEHLIREQHMPAITEVTGVKITGSRAKVAYHNIPFQYTGQAYDYPVLYELKTHGVEERGHHQPPELSLVMRSDFSRTPMGSDFSIMKKLGNVSYTPYDYEEDWVNSYVNIPIAGTTMRCHLGGDQEYSYVSSITCVAQKPIFPKVEKKSPVAPPGYEPTPDPVTGKYSVAEMNFSMPVYVTTSNKQVSDVDADFYMEDEATTRVAGIVFDTHGDSVVISDNDWEFTLSPQVVIAEKSHAVDESRWPRD